MMAFLVVLSATDIVSDITESDLAFGSYKEEKSTYSISSSSADLFFFNGVLGLSACSIN